jgi:hypothetical protein
MAFTTLESKEKLKSAVYSRLIRERKSAKEIQEVLDSLKARTLTYAEYKAMPSDVASWHEFANSANVDKALDAHKDEQKKAASKIKNSVERMWTGAASTDESEAAWNTAEKFMKLYPQVRPTDSATGAAFRKYMRLNNLDPREFTSWETALSALAATNQPEIFLSPKAAGIGPEEQLGGYSLRSYPNLYLLLRPAPTPEQAERIKASKMSADEWKRSRPELADPPPFAMQQQIDLAIRSLASFEADYVFTTENNEKLLQYVHKNKLQFNLTGLRVAFNALKDQLELKPHTASGQVLVHTEYEPRETGQPEAPGKLRAKVARMSSSEMAQFLRENPSARRAIDGM